MMIPKTCANEACGKQFEAGRKDVMYCSEKCKREAFYLKKGKMLALPALGEIQNQTPKQNGSASQNNSSPLSALMPQYDYIVKDLTRQRDNLEKDLREKTTELKVATQKLSEINKEFDEYKNDQRIQSIEVKKPALGGLLENPTVVEMLSNIAPVLAAKIMGTGVQGFSDERVNQLANWFDKLEENKKLLFWGMIEPLTKMPEEQAALLIQNFVALSTKGSTVHSANKEKPSFQMGYG